MPPRLLFGEPRGCGRNGRGGGCCLVIGGCFAHAWPFAWLKKSALRSRLDAWPALELCGREEAPGGRSRGAKRRGPGEDEDKRTRGASAMRRREAVWGADRPGGCWCGEGKRRRRMPAWASCCELQGVCGVQRSRARQPSAGRERWKPEGGETRRGSMRSTTARDGYAGDACALLRWSRNHMATPNMSSLNDL